MDWNTLSYSYYLIGSCIRPAKPVKDIHESFGICFHMWPWSQVSFQIHTVQCRSARSDLKGEIWESPRGDRSNIHVIVSAMDQEIHRFFTLLSAVSFWKPSIHQGLMSLVLCHRHILEKSPLISSFLSDQPTLSILKLVHRCSPTLRPFGPSVCVTRGRTVNSMDFKENISRLNRFFMRKEDLQGGTQGGTGAQGEFTGVKLMQASEWSDHIVLVPSSYISCSPMLWI